MTPGNSVDVDAFMEDGFTVVRGAVPRTVASAVLREIDAIVERTGDEPWSIQGRSVYDLPVLIDVVTDAVRAAFDVLAGRKGWNLVANWGFPIRWPGPIEPLWHIDGDWFTHHLTSGEQILTPIFLWHDIDDRDAPTLLARGSHRDVARLLADHEPEGIPGPAIGTAVHAGINVTDPVPATGKAGDVYICHPFLAHSFNPIGPSGRRVISNVCVHSNAPIDVVHPVSPVARSIANAVTSPR